MVCLNSLNCFSRDSTWCGVLFTRAVQPVQVSRWRIRWKDTDKIIDVQLIQRMRLETRKDAVITSSQLCHYQHSADVNPCLIIDTISCISRLLTCHISFRNIQTNPRILVQKAHIFFQPRSFTTNKSYVFNCMALLVWSELRNINCWVFILIVIAEVRFI
jgi:hypothetical protein